jgi:hypothetical protein
LKVLAFRLLAGSRAEISCEYKNSAAQARRRPLRLYVQDSSSHPVDFDLYQKQEISRGYDNKEQLHCHAVEAVKRPHVS